MRAMKKSERHSNLNPADRVNSESDSYEIDESDLQYEKHSEHRI
jgi:hypothetical protein